jgi:peptidylprolyl isomerase
VPALAACGESKDSAASESSAGASDSPGVAAGELDEVSFTGEVGEGITGEWSSAIEAPAETTATTLIEGDGDPVTEGDTVSAYLWVGNGTSQEQVFSDYDNGAPESIPNDPDQLDAIFAALLAGQTYGSRVAVVTSATEVFGEAENQLGVDPTDTLVIVADLVAKAEVAPTPTDDQAHDASPDQQPSVVEEGGAVTGLDFSGIEEPALDTPVQRVVLKEGTGAALKASDTVTVNYLGSTYAADAPFDESYSTGEPLNSPLSGLIQGWTIGLTGVKVGSRVLLQIPPGYGYGAQASGAIPANSTLWFVIDVVKAE